MVHHDSGSPFAVLRGGKIYQVLREPTLSLHPDSLLTQMAEDQKDDNPIFVEGLGSQIASRKQLGFIV